MRILKPTIADFSFAAHDHTTTAQGGVVFGVTGTLGPTGPTGADSAVPGPTGPQGTAGIDGPTGPAGTAGVAGADGATGPAGTAGVAGADGPTGPQGPAGPNVADETPINYTPASGGTAAIDLGTAHEHRVWFTTGPASVTVANAANGKKFVVSFTQDATGSRTVTNWFPTIKWSGGTAPTLTTATGKRDTFGFISTGTNTFDGFIIGQNV